MKCPFCDSEDTKVIDSRSFLDGHSIKRRRSCNSCHQRFSTYERVEEMPLYIVKKDSRRVKYDRNKLLRGLTSATVKRNISRDTLEQFVFDIEKTIQSIVRNEISSSELGKMVLEKLKDLDQVAYVRFASVYEDFNDIKSFIEVVEKIEKEKS